MCLVGKISGKWRRHHPPIHPSIRAERYHGENINKHPKLLPTRRREENLKMGNSCVIVWEILNAVSTQSVCAIPPPQMTSAIHVTLLQVWTSLRFSLPSHQLPFSQSPGDATRSQHEPDHNTRLANLDLIHRIWTYYPAAQRGISELRPIKLLVLSATPSSRPSKFNRSRSKAKMLLGGIGGRYGDLQKLLVITDWLLFWLTIL